MKKSDIIESIQINNEIIARHKSDIKKLEKARKLLEEVGFDLSRIDEAIAYEKESIAMVAERNEKRKKQLKLVEQLEALDNE